MRGSAEGAGPRLADISVSSSIFEEAPVIVGILAPPSPYGGVSPCGGMRALHSLQPATFWGEERHQRLVEDFPLEFAAWLYRPRYYVTCCCVLGVANFVIILLVIWRVPYGDTNVRPRTLHPQPSTLNPPPSTLHPHTLTHSHTRTLTHTHTPTHTLTHSHQNTRTPACVRPLLPCMHHLSL